MRGTTMDKTQLYAPSATNVAFVHIFDESGYKCSKQLGTLTMIGRGSDQTNCDIVLQSPIVSRKHGEIAFSKNDYFYKDLGSTNGTYVNGKLYGAGASENAIE